MKVITVAACVLIAPLTAWSLGPVGDQVAGQIGSTVEQQTEDAVEQAVEEQVRQQVESAVEESVEESVEETVESTVGDQVTSGIEDQVSESVEESVSGAVGESVQGQVGQAVEETVAGTLDGSIEENIGASVNEVVETATESTVAGAVHSVVDDALDNVSSAGNAAAGGLPSSLAITSDSGETLFYEVGVEDGWRAVRREWLVMVDDGDLRHLRREGIQVVETIDYGNLGMTLVRVRVAGDLDSPGAMKSALPEAHSLDRNHTFSYRPQSGPPSAGDTADGGKSLQRKTPLCSADVSIGVVDTAVDTGHSALAGAAITQRDFLPGQVRTPRDHGSAVAGILVGRGAEIQGAVPNGRLSVASVMYQRPDHSQGATAVSLLGALDWLAADKVAAINFSLAGPPNRILEKALDFLAGRGIVLVAAVGNDGPAAAPLYPAAYGGVIGVTAVDNSGGIYRWANRGEQVDFAALGVGVKTAGAGDRVVIESGTSMAAPVVAAHAACLAGKPGGKDGMRALKAALASKSVDLGEPGKDTTYGFGYLD